MEKWIAEEIIACLPEGRTLFYYFKDRYALMLLAWVVGDGMRVAELKGSRYAGLLDKPVVKRFLAGNGGNRVAAEALQACWPQPPEVFLLGLTIWGSERQRQRSWCQLSRPGFNLVLQLNFSNQHDRPYQRLVRPVAGSRFNYSRHPVMRPGQRAWFRETLAWARIDVDLDRGEALIEEVQSDWIGYARELERYIRRNQAAGRGETRLGGITGSNAGVLTYVDEVLGPYVRIWDEAMLAAAVGFIRDELAIRSIYFHDFETGMTLKGLTPNSQPPRSLYTHLPRRFCFQRTRRMPGLLSNEKTVRKALKKLSEPCWYYLQL
ncbi:MAG: hypothetical protein H6969_08465 [Gammaproteobacteria bacterium]|nr:hypothetical protein [Gammaproteobacteria bacterium]